MKPSWTSTVTSHAHSLHASTEKGDATFRANEPSIAYQATFTLRHCKTATNCGSLQPALLPTISRSWSMYMGRGPLTNLRLRPGQSFLAFSRNTSSISLFSTHSECGAGADNVSYPRGGPCKRNFSLHYELGNVVGMVSARVSPVLARTRYPAIGYARAVRIAAAEGTVSVQCPDRRPQRLERNRPVWAH